MTDTRYPAILLFGAPGVGKGTQGRVLDAVLGFHHVSSGDIFRALHPESPEGREAAEYSTRGELVPDELTIRIFNAVVPEMISRGEYSPDAGILVLDGIPRTVRQAEILDDTVDVLAVLHLDFSDENVMIERMKRRAEQQNRPDDADETTIRRRFEVYRRETEPVLAHFPSSRVHRINAGASPLRVARDLLDALVPVVEDR
ncbi:MAG: adenylate kinase family protein [Planctomycetaceae bacterium]